MEKKTAKKTTEKTAKKTEKKDCIDPQNMLKEKIEQLIHSVLDDQHGISENAYKNVVDLAIMTKSFKAKRYVDNAIHSQNRYFLPEQG